MQEKRFLNVKLGVSTYDFQNVFKMVSKCQFNFSKFQLYPFPKSANPIVGDKLRGRF